MKYVNARALLPKELVSELQEYIQGGYLYIPAVQEQKKCWGELYGYREELRQRNQRIMEEYRGGRAVEAIAEKYCLSVHTIRKIVYYS